MGISARGGGEIGRKIIATAISGIAMQMPNAAL